MIIIFYFGNIKLFEKVEVYIANLNRVIIHLPITYFLYSLD